MLEPQRMSLYVGVVRRALEGEVECDLDAELTRFRQETAKLLERAHLPQDVLVPALCRTDRPRTADILGCCGQGVVDALAVDAPDRVDGRKVQHVEAHVGQVRQPGLDVPKSAVPARLEGCRTGEYFIPAAEARALAVRNEFPRHRRRQTAVRITRDDGGARGVERHRLLGSGVGTQVPGGRT